MEMRYATQEEMENIIKTVGFYRTKARHLIESSKKIMEEFDGTVPKDIDQLLRLPGVGRKTANLVASACFGSPGIIVDTHVMRVSIRLGIYAKRDPEAIERTIAENLDPIFHTAFSHALNRHGKFVCTARSPACMRSPAMGRPTPPGLYPHDYPVCPLEGICPKIGLAL